MGRDEESAVAKLVDRQEIIDCLLRYTRGVDRLDEELIRSAFHEDAFDSHGTVNGSPEEFLAFWLPGQPNRQVAQHFVTNHSVELDGDGADVETYFLVTRKLFDSEQVELLGGRYVDRFERRDGEWRIKTRVVLIDWQSMTDGSSMAKELTLHHVGARDRTDPSYERPVQARHSVS